MVGGGGVFDIVPVPTGVGWGGVGVDMILFQSLMVGGGGGGGFDIVPVRNALGWSGG